MADLRSDYTVKLYPGSATVVGVIAIIDLNLGSVSVTNDADDVIRDLVGAGFDLDSMRVIYRDSTGEWDRMATKGGRFRKFLPLPRGLDEAGAIAAVRKMIR